MSISMPSDFWSWKSWVESANDPEVGFPLQSLPYCAFVAPEDAGGPPHLGVGIGDFILDLHRLAHAGLLVSLDAETQAACTAPQLNHLMRCGPAACSALRRLLIDLLVEQTASANQTRIEPLLIAQQSVHFLKPVHVENYTDFYASIHHATNVGRLFRPEQPLLPNYKWLPVGYHGRASSLVISGCAIRRPQGQIRLPASEVPAFGSSVQLDYELEVAAYVGTGNALGTPIPIAEAEAHIFGFSLLNDWSARDIQAWEYQPLGPFLGKSFATSISPWVLPIETLLPFKVPMQARQPEDPEPLAYLADPASQQIGGLDLHVEAWISTAQMRNVALAPVRLSVGNLRDLYWSFAQMIAHHTSNGCNLVTGDLLASGTVSGALDGSQGSLLEITRRGAAPLQLPNGESRTFLKDGDEIILRGYCERDGLPRISFGECRGIIMAADGAG